MLREVKISHRDAGMHRRWFTDRKLDLIVWIAADSTIDGFQLCYVCPGSEYALTWTRDDGYHHDRIDDAERIPTRNPAANLVSAGVLRRFHENSLAIDPEIRRKVEERLHALTATFVRSGGRGIERRTAAEAVPCATL